ncbi:TPA: DEAD/DEAH box helicase family protein [Elizabethkingia meningoseptica]
MDLANKDFIDFPIEFKQINPEDFKGAGGKGLNVSDKVVVKPDNNGYIYEALKEKIDLSEKNTVVVNAPVGYGKTYAVIKTIEEIYTTVANSTIIVAAPFKGLVSQYATEIFNGKVVEEEALYSYLQLKYEDCESFKDKRVHIVTVNTLLQNPGDEGFKSSELKANYLRTIIREAKTKGGKVFFIYDEIHDAVHNFKEELIFNLWKWKDVAHKNIIVSATFSEASKVVIRYLSELTDRKLQIIEAVRKRFPEKQSDLYLHYSEEYRYTVSNGELLKVVDNLISRDKNIDILCYSRTLAKDILKGQEGIGKILKENYGKMNDCTSSRQLQTEYGKEVNANSYNDQMCNVGTNFKTGISITKEDHAFVIILPPRAAKGVFTNYYGIFAGGINDVIQAIARQRGKGEIHILLPKPGSFDYESLPTNMKETQLKAFKNQYNKIAPKSMHNKDTKYLELDKQEGLLKSFYTTKRKEVQEEINHIKAISAERESLHLPRLLYPTLDLFKLAKGEQYLANTFGFYGDDLSAYVTYSAITNQFINCNLKAVNTKEALVFTKGEIQRRLFQYVNEYIGEIGINLKSNPSNFALFYKDIREELFNNYSLYLASNNEEDDKKSLKPYSDKDFEVQLLLFCHKVFNNYTSLDKTNYNDNDYTRGQYLLDCISVTTREIENNSKEQKQRIQTFQFLGTLRQKLINNIQESNRAPKYHYLPVNPFEGFIDQEESKELQDVISYLEEKDIFFKNKIFSLRRGLSSKNFSSQSSSLYSILLEDFFELEKVKDGKYKKITIEGNKVLVRKILRQVPFRNSGVNVVELEEYDPDYMKAMEEQISYNSLDEYFIRIYKALKDFF